VAITLNDLIRSETMLVPLLLRAKYKGHLFRATITERGTVLFEGREFQSQRRGRTPLSTVGGEALASVRTVLPGRRVVPLDGWKFWRFKDADGQWRPVDELRLRFQRKHPTVLD
jgi:hypothetical protein